METEGRVRVTSTVNGGAMKKLLYAAFTVDLVVNLSMIYVSRDDPDKGVSALLFFLNVVAIVLLLVQLAIPSSLRSIYRPRAGLVISLLFVIAGTIIGSVVILSIMAILTGSSVHSWIILGSCLAALVMFVGIVLTRD
jgi:hypothetical protein